MRGGLFVRSYREVRLGKRGERRGQRRGMIFSFLVGGGIKKTLNKKRISLSDPPPIFIFFPWLSILRAKLNDIACEQ